MATQRKAFQSAEKDDLAPSLGLKVGGDPGTSNITPAVPAPVIYKLLLTTLLMAALPIGSYFATVNTIFHGNSTWAGLTAAIVANVVLVGYVIAAYNEDVADREDASKGKGRERGKVE